MNFAVPPSEGIAIVHFFGKNQEFIGASTWSGKIFFYQSNSTNPIAQLSFPCPILDFYGLTPDSIVAGGADGNLYFASGQTISAHSKAISSISRVPNQNLLLTSSFDKTMKLWRYKNTKAIELVLEKEFLFDERILYSKANQENQFVAYGHKNALYVGSLVESNVENRISSLRQQISSLAIKSQGDGWAVGSIDGLIAIEYFGDIIHQAQRFAFSCHRHPTPDGKVMVYPVNTLAFCQNDKFLISGGSDGIISIWDIEEKRKAGEIKVSDQERTSIASISLHTDDKTLLVGVSDKFDQQGQNNHGVDQLMLFDITNYITEK